MKNLYLLAALALAAPVFTPLRAAPIAVEADAPITSAAVETALERALGTRVMAVIESISEDKGQTSVQARLGDISANLLLEKSEDGTLVLSDAHLLQMPALLDLKQKAAFENFLHQKSEFQGAAVLAFGQVKDRGDGITRWQVWVEIPGQDNRMLVLEESTRGYRLGRFRYDAQAFRQMAGPLGVKAALDLCTAFQEPLNRLGMLEVLLKRTRLDPKQYAFVSMDDSPIGFQVDREKQLQLPPLVSDNTAYVTINRRTGALRAELFN